MIQFLVLLLRTLCKMILHVSQTVLDNIARGFYVTLDDGIHTDNLGRVTAVNKTDGTIVVENAASQNFSSASPTYVKVTVRPIDNLELVSSMVYNVGESKIGGLHIPANQIVRISYTNNSSSQKQFVFSYEYLY